MGLEITGDGALFGAMATPAVLLLGNAMLILSTNQRLQAILARIQESTATLGRIGEERGEGKGNREGRPGGDVFAGGVRDILRDHLRRERLAHRALFSFYPSAMSFLVLIGALGAGGMGVQGAGLVVLLATFVGAGLLLTGAGLLMAETWVGLRATDRYVDLVGSRIEAEGISKRPPVMGPEGTAGRGS